MAKKIFLFFFLFFIFPSSVLATNYYVSTSGSDSNTGTTASPFRTIQRGVTVAQAGDTVYVRGGTYNEQVSISRTGTTTQPITISGYPNERPIIDGQRTLPGNEWSSLVSLSGSNIVFNNFEVRYSGGIGISITGNYNLIKNCSSHHSYNNGILISGSGSYNTVEDSEVWYNCTDNENGQAGHWATGMSAARSPNHSTFRRNKVYNNWGEGLSAFETGGYVVMEDNVVYDNYAINIYIDNSPNTIVRRNLIYSGDSRFSKAPGIAFCDEKAIGAGTYDVQIVNNLVLGGNRAFYHWKQSGSNGLRNWLIAYNTFVNSNSQTLFQIAPGGHSNSRIGNNIFVQDGSLPILTYSSDSNIQFFNNLWSKSGGAGGSGDFVADPRLSKTGLTGAGQLTANWFRILSDSPAINKARVLSEVTEDYFRSTRGSSPDIGGHEYGGPQPTNPPLPTATRTPTPTPISNPTPTPTTPPSSPELILDLKFEEGSGATTTDSSGNNNNTQIINTTFTTDRKVGNYAVSLNGTNSYLKVPDSSTMDFYKYQGTIEMWVKPVNPANGSYQILATDSSYGMEFDIQDDGDLFFYPWVDSSYDNYVLATNPLVSGQWQHVAATWNFSTKVVKLYVNGQEKPLTVNNTAAYWSTIASTADWHIGGSPLTADRYFNGNIDNVRVYSRQLSSSEILSHYNQVAPSPTPTVILCARKGEGDANCDGAVNILDFEVWRREFLGIDTTTKADFDSSGGVTILDFEIWRRGFLGQ